MDYIVKEMAAKSVPWVSILLAIAVITALVMCSGCATVPPPEKPLVAKVETIETTKIVVQPCVTVEQVRTAPKTALADGQDEKQHVEALDVDLRALQGLAAEYEALLRKCVAGAPPPVPVVPPTRKP